MASIVCFQSAIGKTRLDASGGSMEENDPQAKTDEVREPEGSEGGLKIGRLYFFGEDGEKKVAKSH